MLFKLGPLASCKEKRAPVSNMVDQTRRSQKLTLTRDEGNELANTFLHTLLRLLCDLGVVGKSILHDASDWSKVANVSIKLIKFVGL